MVDAWHLVRCGKYTHAKSEIVLDCENVVIGRNVEPKYRLDSVNISRQHACLRYSSGGQWEITDLRSHNGVFVNGARIQASHRVALSEGDVIGFGKAVPSGDDVFVFALEKKCVGVAVKNELPDSPTSASPASDVVLLSDDDDIVVTKVHCAKRRLTISTSSNSAAATHCSSPSALDAAPQHVAPEKKPFDGRDRLCYGGSAVSTGPAIGTAHTDVPLSADTTRFSISPQQQVLSTTVAIVPKAEPFDAVGRVKIERDCESTDSRSTSSRDTSNSRPSLPVGLTFTPAASNRSSIKVSSPALLPHTPGTYIKQEVPGHIADIGVVPIREPSDVPSYIKQEPDCLTGEQAQNVEKAVVTPAHQSECLGDLPLHSIVGSSSRRTDCSSTVSRKVKVNSCNSTSLSCPSEQKAECDTLYRSDLDVCATAKKNVAAPVHSLGAPKTDVSSTTVKEEPVLSDCSSNNIVQSIVKSNVPADLSISSIGFGKTVRSGLTPSGLKATDAEQCSTFSLHENKNGEKCAGSKYVPCQERSYSPTACSKNVSNLPNPPRCFNLSLLVKPCSVVLQRLESSTLASLSGQQLTEGGLVTQGDHNHVEAGLVENTRNTTNEDSCHGISFSQDDVIIILSDSDDDCNGGIDFEIKKEPEEAEDIISNDADVEAGIPWINSCLNDGTEERKTVPVCSVTQDKELEKRLVWNESEPEQTTSTEQEQPENDFFPALSQDFSDSEALPAKIKRTSTPARAILLSSAHHLACLKGKVNRSPKKKSCLKEKLMKSMKHRIPMAGGGSAVQKKDGEGLLKSSSAAECEGGLKKSHYKVRFQSRSACLLSTEEPSKPSASTSKSKPGKIVKPLNDMQTVQNRVESAKPLDISAERTKQVSPSLYSAQLFPEKGKAPRVSDVSAETTSQLRPSWNAMEIRPQLDVPLSNSVSTEITNRLSSSLKECALVPQVNNFTRTDSSEQGKPCFSVPRFKKAVRISRLATGSPVPAATSGDPTVVEQRPSALPLIPVPMDPLPEPMDIDVSERRSRVHFHIEEPSSKTDEQRAEFALRVRASLKKKKFEHSQKSKINLGVFISYILNWKVHWLKEQLQSAMLPPLLDMDKFRSKRFMYSSLEEYKFVNYHFLCLEVWQTVFRSWREHFARTTRMTFSSAVVRHTCPPGDTMILTCVVLVTSEQMHKSLYPFEGHLVRLDLRIRDQAKAALPAFGFVTQHKFLRDPRVRNSAIPDLLQSVYTDGCIPVTLQIQVKTRPVTLDFGKVQRLSVVAKITPALRQMEAVLELEKSAFAKCIVRPNVSHFWCQKGVPMSSRFRENFNDEQKKVISSTVAAMRERGGEPRIIILHGPPGTGKTHTVVGAVTEILQHNSKQTVLIVAPSNAAVDEIGRRLLAHRQWQYRQKVPAEQVLKVVRIGQNSMVHAEVRGICLDELLQKNIQKDEIERCKEYDQTICALEIEVKRCTDKKCQLEKSACQDVRAFRRLEFQITHLRSQIQQAKEKKKLITDSHSRQFRNVNDKKLVILRNAHVILSTLNSCRSRLMEEAFGCNSSHNFSCVLLDEATQCTEVEALLGLQYRTSRLILVGDPMQLPATVVSQDAVDRGFQESLFERFYNYLKQEVDSKPIFTLSEQRRMHSEICQFPSNYFYDGKLRPVLGLDAKYASFPLTPYLVFNIKDSPEVIEATSTSWLNRGEAAFVAHLCLAISQHVVNVSLGIITPYQAQKSAIIQQLQESFAPGAATFDVNTVDGFQGQERDVIVLSCVRAHNPRGNIGFVADARRLNVAITRARKALYICGHLDSLKDSEEWNALISDAYDRSKVMDISAECSSDHLADKIKKHRVTGP
ncbi:uncharacterized protein [Dermacentor albipictus]|uniref:uncharacterized protein n=1 Tax=Dermacentor albipictus TaxID=60249 RepID=UPI0031FDF59E